MDPERHEFAENLKSLQIVDRRQIWVLNFESINFIMKFLNRLEIVEIVGNGMIPIKCIPNFLAQLNGKILKKLRLEGSREEFSMCWQEFCWIPGRVAGPINQLLLRCSKLESLTLGIF